MILKYLENRYVVVHYYFINVNIFTLYKYWIFFTYPYDLKLHLSRLFFVPDETKY